MNIIQRGYYCNIHDPLDPEERVVFEQIVRAGDAGFHFEGRAEPHVVLSIYNLDQRGYIEPTDESSNEWRYRVSYAGRQFWLRLVKGDVK